MVCARWYGEKHRRDHLYCIRAIVFFPCFHTVFDEIGSVFLLFLFLSLPFYNLISSLSFFLFLAAKFLFIVRFSFYPPSFLPVLYAYIYDVFFTFVSSFIEYLCLCVRADFFVSVSSLLFERRRIRQLFGGRSTLSVLVSLMRGKRNEKSYLLFIYHVLVLFLLHLVRWTPFIDAYTRLSSLFFSPFPIFSFPNVIIFFSVLFVSWFLGSSIQIDIVFLKFLELRRIEGHFISKKLVRFERMNKLKPGNSKSSDLSLKTGSR